MSLLANETFLVIFQHCEELYIKEDWQVPCLEKFQFLATSIFLSIEGKDQAFDTSKLRLKGGVV